MQLDGLAWAASHGVSNSFPHLPCTVRNLFCLNETLRIDLSSFEGQKVDLGDVTLGIPGAIDGTVKSRSGVTGAGARVYVLDPVTWQRARVVSANSEGRYTFTGLPPDAYVLLAETSTTAEIYKGIACSRTYGPYVADGCHDDAHTPVTTTPAEIVVGIDFEGGHRFFGNGFESRPSH